jgi:Family of unknown function (DUF6677)
MTAKQKAVAEKLKPLKFKDYIIIIIGWLIPGLGHAMLKKWGRAALIFVIINFLFFYGIFGLDGKIYSTEPGNPISIFATFGQYGVGSPYFIIKIISKYKNENADQMYYYQTEPPQLFAAGDPASPYYEYGITFAVSAGLLNLLILFDIYDIITGKKK